MSESALSGINTLLQRGTEDSSGAEFETIAEVEYIKPIKLKARTTSSTELSQQDRYQRHKSIYYDSGQMALLLKFSRTEYEQFLSDYQSGNIRSYRIVIPDSDSTTFNLQAIITKFPIRITLKETMRCNLVLKISGKSMLHPAEAVPDEEVSYVYITDSYTDTVMKYENSTLIITLSSLVGSSGNVVGLDIDDSGNVFITDNATY